MLEKFESEERTEALEQEREAQRVQGELERRQERDKLFLNVWKRCELILASIKHHKYGFPFLKPVDSVRDQAPNYYEIIKCPMDLGTITGKMGTTTTTTLVKTESPGDKYTHPLQFKRDMDQVWVNCALYNPPNSYVGGMGNTLKGIFEKRWGEYRLDKAISDIDKQVLYYMFLLKNVFI